MLKQVDDAVLVRLLDLQADDSAIKRLSEQKASLPERQRLAELEATTAELEADIAFANKQRDELTRHQSRLEDEMATLDGKIQREEGRLFAGTVSNPKELSSLQAEVNMLKRKRATLEDELLEVMVNREASDSMLSSLTTEHSNTTGAAEEERATVSGLVGDIDGQLATHTQSRAAIAGEIPTDLIELYEKIRAGKGGVGAAALRGGACRGCHTQLPAKEVERMRGEGGLQRCDNCRRILVIV